MEYEGNTTTNYELILFNSNLSNIQSNKSVYIL